MTRRPGAQLRQGARPRQGAQPGQVRGSRDPYGLAAAGPFVAPALSALGLAIVALFTLGLFTGHLPFISSGGGGNANGGAQVPDRTPTPSNVIVTTKKVSVQGSIVYVKQGNIWIQSGTDAHQITNTGNDSMPSWSPDGSWIYFVESKQDRGLYPVNGAAHYYTLTYPVLTRVHPDGSGREAVTSGLFKSGGGRYEWFYWLRQPVLAPDGHTIALMSDAPDPANSDVVLQFYDLKTSKLTRPVLPENPPLGHQDPAWRPDGKILLYVKNGRDGARGAPAIWRYFPATGKTTPLTGPGYMSPEFSPDGLYVVATKTGSLGTDVVILDAKNGQELLRLTDDQRSWGGVWSPAGDSIAFLHISGGVVDLETIKLSGAAPHWTASDPIPLTENSGLDGASTPSWYIPGSELPAPTSSGGSPGSTPSASGQ